MTKKDFIVKGEAAYIVIANQSIESIHRALETILYAPSPEKIEGYEDAIKVLKEIDKLVWDKVDEVLPK